MKNKMTKCKIWLVGFTLIASIAFSGCGNSMPECDDKKVLDLVTKITQNYLVASFCFGQDRAFCKALKCDYSAFMINSIDKETKKISCKAKQHRIFPHTDEDHNWLLRLPNVTEPFITYTVQATQDGQVYVEVLDYE